MSDNENYTPAPVKKRTAHLPLLQVNLQHKLQRLKTIWKDFEKTPPAKQINNLTPMQAKAQDRIKNQQNSNPAKPITQKPKPNRPKKTSHQKFIERRAKKHPEIIAQHAPPIHFYHANRPFESRPASYLEDKNRLEGCHHLVFKFENKNNNNKIISK